jgi:hypothetical protein
LTELHGFPYGLERFLLLRAFVHVQRRHARDVAMTNALMAEA